MGFIRDLSRVHVQVDVVGVLALYKALNKM